MIETYTHSWLNIVFARIYMKKLISNVSSAMDDWSFSSKDTKSYTIMTGYARISRIITLFHIIIGILAALLYFSSVFADKKQVTSEFYVCKDFIKT